MSAPGPGALAPTLLARSARVEHLLERLAAGKSVAAGSLWGSSQALLLSETAEFDSKPELEIFADDVVCGHGSTSGQIDEDLLFYLESRGVPEIQARALLIQAFVGEAVERIEHEPLREALSKASAEWLGVSFD